MLTSIQIIGSGVTIPVVDAGPDELFTVREITGLGPVDATINTVEYGVEAEGEFITGTRIGKRNIVLTLGLNRPDEAQDFLNAWLSTGKSILLRFLFDNRDSVEILSYVEKTTPDHFVQDPEGQISLICPKSAFAAVAPQVKTGNAQIAPGFTDVPYLGNKNNGFSLEMAVGGANYVGDVVVEHIHAATGLRAFTIEDVTLAAGSTYDLTTQQGNKHVSSSVLGSLLGLMTDDSYWLTLFPGDNQLRIRTPSSDTARAWTLTYTELYGGI